MLDSIAVTLVLQEGHDASGRILRTKLLSAIKLRGRREKRRDRIMNGPCACACHLVLQARFLMHSFQTHFLHRWYLAFLSIWIPKIERLETAHRTLRRPRISAHPLVVSQCEKSYKQENFEVE